MALRRRPSPRRASASRRPRSPLSACVPVPGLPARAPGHRRARARARPPRHAAASRPARRGLRRGAARGGRGPGCHRLALRSPRPLPRRARSRCRGARTCSRRAGLHGGGRGSWGLRGAGTREGAGDGNHGAPRTELRPRPARAPGELARGGTGRRVTGRGDGEGTRLRASPPSLRAPLRARGTEASSAAPRRQGGAWGWVLRKTPPLPPASLLSWGVGLRRAPTLPSHPQPRPASRATQPPGGTQVLGSGLSSRVRACLWF